MIWVRDGDGRLKRRVDIDPHKAVRAGPEEPPHDGRLMMRMITLGFFSHNQYISTWALARITATLE